MANPTIGATTPRIQYTATGGQTVFTVPFEFLANADLAVYVNGTLQTLTTHYTLTGANTTGGGTCTFVSGRTAGDIVTIIGNLAYSRSTNKYTKFGLLPAEVLEADFDALQVQAKQLARDGQFALRAPLTDTGSPTMTLPVVATRASKVLGFDASGNPTQSASTVAAMDAAVSVINTISASTSGNAGSVVYTPSGSGAVPSTVQTKLREFVSVKDFGAIGDGVANDTAAIQSAINAANTAGGGGVFFPAGTYLVGASNNITLQSNIYLFGVGPASKIKLANNSTISASTSLFAATSKSNISVCNLYLDGNRANQTNLIGLFRLESCSNVELSHVTMVNCNNVGVYFITCTGVICSKNTIVDSNGTNIKLGTSCVDVVIDGNVLYDTGTFSSHYDGFIMSRFGTQNRVVISNNEIQSPAGSGVNLGIWLLCGNNISVTGNSVNIADSSAGITVQIETDMENLSVVGNSINAPGGIQVFDTAASKDISGLIVSNNVIKANNNTGISILPVYASTFSKVSITGNSIVTTMDGAADKGIQITSEGVVVSGNSISMSGSAAGDGIWIGTNLATVTGNNIDMGGVGSRGIMNFGNYSTITGNVVKGTASYGIRNDASTNYVAVVANVLNSCALGILNGGANSVTASNVT